MVKAEYILYIIYLYIYIYILYTRTLPYTKALQGPQIDIQERQY